MPNLPQQFDQVRTSLAGRPINEQADLRPSDNDAETLAQFAAQAAKHPLMAASAAVRQQPSAELLRSDRELLFNLDG
jgi:hypothetical protein